MRRPASFCSKSLGVRPQAEGQSPLSRHNRQTRNAGANAPAFVVSVPKRVYFCGSGPIIMII